MPLYDIAFTSTTFFQILTDFFFNKDSIPHVNLCDKLSAAVFFFNILLCFSVLHFLRKKKKKKKKLQQYKVNKIV